MTHDGARRSSCDHVTDIQLGGGERPRRPESLRVLPDDWADKAMGPIPSTRADCPTYRPCPHLKCEWNAWMRDGRDRPGRRREGHGPPRSTVEVTVIQNCGADLADLSAKGRDVGPVVIGELYGISDRQVRRVVEKGTGKLSEEGDALELLKLTIEK